MELFCYAGRGGEFCIGKLTEEQSDFVFENEIDSSIRGWHSSNLEANINEIVLDTDMIAVEKNNPAIVFSLKSKFRPKDLNSFTITLKDSGVPDSKLLSPFTIDS